MNRRLGPPEPKLPMRMSILVRTERDLSTQRVGSFVGISLLDIFRIQISGLFHQFDPGQGGKILEIDEISFLRLGFWAQTCSRSVPMAARLHEIDIGTKKASHRAVRSFEPSII